MTEEAKAAQEIAKATGKAIDAGREMGGFISKYIGGPIEQAMGIFEDKLKYLRWERQVRLMDRASEFLKERGTDGPTRAVALPIAVPLLQAGSLEEDDELQDRWAALLANAADANVNIEIRRAFISILEDLTPLDARILEKIYETERELNSSEQIPIYTAYLPDRATTEQPEEGRPDTTIQVSVGNLARLGLVEPWTAFGGMATVFAVHQTALGRGFVRACARVPPG